MYSESISLFEENKVQPAGINIPVNVNTNLHQRIVNLDWNYLYKQLYSQGFAILPKVLTQEECEQLIHEYDQAELFRSKISMQRYSFGQGEYQYYQYPLPNIIESLRQSLYPALAPVANDWASMLNMSENYPLELDKYLHYCHEKEQIRPTPLILKYTENDYNCLHQDLYGDIQFPLQAVFVLNQKGLNFEGGEFVLVEQRPRRQSKAEVIELNQGEGIIFSVSSYPVKSTRGFSRFILRHGVSKVRKGHRYAMGIIFHDAK